MTPWTAPQCSWVGMKPDDGGQEVPCGKPATYFIEEPTGHRVYTCLEHLSHAKTLAPTGHEVHEVPVRNHNAPSARSAVRMG
jgi:hypothetical protein